MLVDFIPPPTMVGGRHYAFGSSDWQSVVCQSVVRQPMLQLARLFINVYKCFFNYFRQNAFTDVYCFYVNILHAFGTVEAIITKQQQSRILSFYSSRFSASAKVNGEFCWFVALCSTKTPVTRCSWMILMRASPDCLAASGRQPTFRGQTWYIMNTCTHYTSHFYFSSSSS